MSMRNILKDLEQSINNMYLPITVLFASQSLTLTYQRKFLPNINFMFYSKSIILRQIVVDQNCCRSV